jgi:hypothetical protein
MQRSLEFLQRTCGLYFDVMASRSVEPSRSLGTPDKLMTLRRRYWHWGWFHMFPAAPIPATSLGGGLVSDPRSDPPSWPPWLAWVSDATNKAFL